MKTVTEYAEMESPALVDEAYRALELGPLPDALAVVLVQRLDRLTSPNGDLSILGLYPIGPA